MGSVDVPKFVRDRMKEQIQNGKKPSESNVPSFAKKKDEAVSEDISAPSQDASKPAPTGISDIPQSELPSYSAPKETPTKSFLDLDIERQPGFLLTNPELDKPENKYSLRNLYNESAQKRYDEKLDLAKSNIKATPESLSLYNQKRIDDVNKDIKDAKNNLKGLVSAAASGGKVSQDQMAPYEKQLAEANQYKANLKNSIAREAAKTIIPAHLAKGNSFDPKELARDIVKVADPEQELILQEAEKGGSTLPGITQANMEKMGLELAKSYIDQQPDSDENKLSLDKISQQESDFDERNFELTAQRVREKLGVYFYNAGENGGLTSSGQSGFWGYSGKNIESAINDPAAGLTPSEKKIALSYVLPMEKKLFFSTEIPGSGFFRSAKNAIDRSLLNTENTITGWLGGRDDSDRAQDLLNAEVGESRFRQPGENLSWKQELKYLNNKGLGQELNADEKARKVELEKYVDVRNGFSKFKDGVGDLTGQVVEMALLTKGIGGLGRAATALGEENILSGLTTSAVGTALSNETVGLFLTSYLNAYDSYKTQAIQLMPGDKNAANRDAYAKVMAGVEGLSERIFNDVKVLKAFTNEAAPSILGITNRFINKEITQRVAREELQTTLQKYLKPFGKSFIRSEVEEPTEEAVVDLADGMAQSIFGGQPFDIIKTGQKAVNTFLTTALNSPLVAGMAAHGAVRQNQTENAFMKSAIVDIANNPTSYLQSVEDLRLNNQITQDEANEKIKLINSASKYLKEIPSNITVEQKTKEGQQFTDKQLDYPEVSSYLIHRLNEGLVNDQIEKSKDEALKPSLEGKVKRSVEIRKGIIDGTIGVTPELEEVTDNPKKAQELGILDSNTSSPEKLIGTPFEQKLTTETGKEKEVVDIERRRQEDIDKLDNVKVGDKLVFDNGTKDYYEEVTSIRENGDIVFKSQVTGTRRQSVLKEINGKYDAELKSIEKSKTKQESKKEPKATKAPKEEGVMKKARGIDDLQEPIDVVMQYFAGGNKINPSAIQELFGGKDQRLHQQKGTGGEHRSRISLMKKDAPSIKELAHSLWESSQDENGNSLYTDQDFRDAIEQVLNEHNSPSSMAKELVRKYLDTAVSQDLTEAEAAEMDGAAIAQIDELLADVPQKHKNQLLGLLRKYQDQYGFVNWEAVEKDNNGFTPIILSLPLETQRVLDGLVKKYYTSGQSESGDVSSEDNLQEQTEVEETANAPPTQSTIEAAQSAYDKAVTALKKAEDKISKSQTTQGSLLPSEGTQGAMFGVNRDEAKSILDPLRKQVKETKAALEAAQKSVDTTQGQPELPLVTKPSIINGNQEESSGQESSQESGEEGRQESQEDVTTKGGENDSSVQPPFNEKKVGDAARKFADNLRKGKINKLGGFKSSTGFDAIWDGSLEVIAKAIDAGAEIADAIQEGLLYIKKTDWYKNLTDKKAFDKQFTDHFDSEIGEPPTTPPDTHRFSNSESSHERVRGAYKHLMDSEIPEGVKEKFRSGGLTKNGLGIKYKVSDNGEAQAAGKAIISAFGADEALRLARTNTFHPSVNSAIFSEAINDFYNQEQEAKKPQEKFAAATRWADTYNEYAELLTASGQFGQYAFQFYKTSPLGFILSAKERLDERRRHFLERDEKSLKEAFEYLKDLPEFQEIFSEEVQEAVKKSKNEIKKEVRKKISDAFDKLKLQKNVTYATFVPPPIINGAIEAMKQAVLLGYEVVDVIAEGIKYINARHKEGWNQEKFETDFTPIVEKLISDTATKRSSASDQKKILDKWDRKLSKLDPAKRKELLSRVLGEIVRNGGLEYDKFKEMYADALGLPSMTPAMEGKLKGLGTKLNDVDKAKEKLDKDPSEENIKEFLKAMNEGEKASRQVNDLLGEKGITLDRFLSIAKLNTLGLMNLFINPFYNLSFMPVRFLESMLKTGMDYALKYAGFVRSDGLYENTFYKQRGYVKGLGKGFVKSIINLYRGDQQFDYFQKTTRQNIQPVESAKEIFAHFQGARPLTKPELANAFMEVWPTMGVSAAIISRGLQVGDLPFRFASERATAENIATQKGLTGVKRRAFILNPDEASKEKITDAGARAVMAQDNLLTDLLNRVSSFFTHAGNENKVVKVGFGAAKIVGATTQPFLKIPLNSAMTVFELAVPEFSILKGIYYASTGNRDQALSAFSRAAVGYAIGLAVTQMAQAGLLTGTDDDKDKINTSIYKGDIVGDKTLNFTATKRWLLGGDPSFHDGDVTISLNGLGPVGAMMAMKAQQYDKMSPDKWKQEGYFANLWERMDGGFVNGLKNNVFSNTSTLFSAINDGTPYSFNKWLRGSSNVMLNSFEPQWLATSSKLNDKYRPDYSAMNLGQQMTATLKERFWNGDDLPKQVTVWGQKREDAPKGTNPILYYYADISKSRNVDTDDFGFNVLALYNRTLDDAAIPSRPQKTLKENGQSVRLSPNQYEEFQIMVGTQRKQLTKALMTTDIYNKADDGVKVELLKKQYSNGYSLGEREFWFKHPEIYPAKKKK